LQDLEGMKKARHGAAGFFSGINLSRKSRNQKGGHCDNQRLASLLA